MGAVGTSAAGAPAESMRTLKHEILMNTRPGPTSPPAATPTAATYPKHLREADPNHYAGNRRVSPPNNKRQYPGRSLEDDISSDSPDRAD